jgi:hypothetical protein
VPNIICTKTSVVRLRLCCVVPEYDSCFTVYVILYIPVVPNAPNLNNSGKKLGSMFMANIKGFRKFSLLSAGCCGELVGTDGPCTFKV